MLEQTILEWRKFCGKSITTNCIEFFSKTFQY